MEPSFPLRGKTIVITGGSRGIGRAMALRCARDGANIVLASKTVEASPKLPGTILAVAKEVEAAGGRALAVQTDVRDAEAAQRMIASAAQAFGGIDALINNAGAIQLTSVELTPVKRFDLMLQINTRAVFVVTQAALPHLKRASNPHVINLSPPVTLQSKWYREYAPYTLSKMGMTLLTLGMAAEFQKYGIAVNSLWPRHIIATNAISHLMGEEGILHSLKPEIMADAAYAILATPASQLSGKALIDEVFLAEKGIRDFSGYAVDPSKTPTLDLFVD
jgi:NAD(P)-dependent dehydrogenase (short-subunit alcohol dehydrogenase family)